MGSLLISDVVQKGRNILEYTFCCSGAKSTNGGKSSTS